MTTTTSEPLKSGTTRWFVDDAKSVVEFEVKTFWGLATVQGRFHHFGGSYEIGPDGTQIDLAIDVDSLDTGNATRDKHLRSAAFFHLAEHPWVRFTSTRVNEGSDGTLHVEGHLDAAGRAVPLEFDASRRQVDDGLEVEATATLDQRSLGMSSGQGRMIRPPATLHVRARLVGTEG